MAECGGITESNANSDEIAILAQFAVEEHKKKQNAELEFGKVVSAKQQVVQGVMHYITVEVNEGGETKTYEAKIWVKAWEDFKELQEFKLV